MANAPIELGPSGLRAAENVKRIRTAKGLDLGQLSERLSRLGRPIGVPALSRVENGARRLDIADLIAISLALGVSPNALLFGSDKHLGPKELPLTGEVSASMDEIWRWADGEFPLDGGTDKEQLEFQRQARPHLPPVIHRELPRAVRDLPVARDLEQAYTAAAQYFERDRTVLDLLMGELRRELEEPFDFEKWFGGNDVFNSGDDNNG